MRIAALRVPDFPVQALRRSHPELAEAPLAVPAGPAPRDVIVGVAAEAAEMGVKPGMTAAQARQVAPAVLLREAPAEVIGAAEEALADVAGALSPRVKRTRPGEVLLDVGGLAPRWGSEEAVAGELLRRCHRVGLAARAGVAGRIGVALAASRYGEAVIVRPGGERAFLAPLPLSLLEPAPALAAALRRWGIDTAGALAALPRVEVALRLGEDGVRLHELACGEGDEDFIPDPRHELLREGVELEDPLVALEAFLFTLHGLLSRLAARLDLTGAGFAEVSLELRLEGGGSREYRIAMTAPTREVGAVLAMARLQLEAHPPGAAVEGVVAQASPGRVPMVQGSLFTPPLPAPGKLATALARLAALVGPDRVGAPAVPDTHRPGAFALAPFAPTELLLPKVAAARTDSPEQQGPGDAGASPARWGEGAELASAPRGGREISPEKRQRGPEPVARGPRIESRAARSSSTAADRVEQGPTGPRSQTAVLRAFRPPRPAQVTVVNGRPVAVRANGCGGVVVGWAGPYRFAGDWWLPRPFARDDYDVATSDGALLRVYFDRLEKRWYADGLYD